MQKNVSSIESFKFLVRFESGRGDLVHEKVWFYSVYDTYTK